MAVHVGFEVQSHQGHLKIHLQEDQVDLGDLQQVFQVDQGSRLTKGTSSWKASGLPTLVTRGSSNREERDHQSVLVVYHCKGPILFAHYPMTLEYH